MHVLWYWVSWDLFSHLALRLFWIIDGWSCNGNFVWALCGTSSQLFWNVNYIQFLFCLSKLLSFKFPKLLNFRRLTALHYSRVPTLPTLPGEEPVVGKHVQYWEAGGRGRTKVSGGQQIIYQDYSWIFKAGSSGSLWEELWLQLWLPLVPPQWVQGQAEEVGLGEIFMFGQSI